MKKALLSALIATVALGSSFAQRDVEVVLSTFAGAGAGADWAEYASITGSTVITPDSELIAAGTDRIYVSNGNSTADSDGSAIVSFDLGVLPFANGLNPVVNIPGILNPGTGDTSGAASLEGALIQAGWAGGAEIDSDYRGMDVDANGNLIIAFDDSGNADAALIRVNSSSDVTGTVSYDVLFGSTALANDMDGTFDIAVDRDTNIAYAGQLSIFGAPEARIVTFDLNATPPLAATVFKSEADLVAAGIDPGLDFLQGIDVADGVVYFTTFESGANSTRPAVTAFPISGGFTTVATQDVFQPTEIDNFETGAISVSESSGSIFLHFDDTFNFYKIPFGSGAPLLYLTAANIEADPDYVNDIAGGIVENQDFNMAHADDGFLYISLESDNSDTDSVIRVADGDILTSDPLSATLWTSFE
jgi:hypothetical protein